MGRWDPRCCEIGVSPGRIWSYVHDCYLTGDDRFFKVSSPLCSLAIRSAVSAAEFYHKDGQPPQSRALFLEFEIAERVLVP
jgi:hypothetical protein